MGFDRSVGVMHARMRGHYSLAMIRKIKARAGDVLVHLCSGFASSRPAATYRQENFVEIDGVPSRWISRGILYATTPWPT